MSSEPLWTQDDITTLKNALRSGVLTVTYAGPPARTVTYQNLDAMRRLLAEMRSEVNTAAGGRSYTLAATRKGL